jgi:hypothetical protein
MEQRKKFIAVDMVHSAEVDVIADTGHYKRLRKRIFCGSDLISQSVLHRENKVVVLLFYCAVIRTFAEKFRMNFIEKIHHIWACVCFFAAIEYPVFAAAAMSTKILSDSIESHRAYEEIQALTKQYNEMNGGKWRHLMDAAPRKLPVFEDVHAQLTGADQPCIMMRNAADYQSASDGTSIIQMLGHSMNAVAMPKEGHLTFDIEIDAEGDYVLQTALIPTQPNDSGDLRFSVSIDDNQPVVYSLKEPFRSERWKQNVLSGQAIRDTKVHLHQGRHTITVRALDHHIVFDQLRIFKSF